MRAGLSKNLLMGAAIVATGAVQMKEGVGQGSGHDTRVVNDNGSFLQYKREQKEEAETGDSQVGTPDFKAADSPSADLPNTGSVLGNTPADSGDSSEGTGDDDSAEVLEKGEVQVEAVDRQHKKETAARHKAGEMAAEMAAGRKDRKGGAAGSERSEGAELTGKTVRFGEDDSQAQVGKERVEADGGRSDQGV